MTEQKTYDAVAFGAHPDDAEMGMAGTLGLLAESGKRVLVVSMTRSERSTYGDPKTRRKEFEDAASCLGCDPLIMDLPDTGVENNETNRRRLVELVRRHTPQVVFAPFHTNEAGHHDGRANVDHMETGRLVRDSLKLARLRSLMPEIPAHDVRRLIYYMVPADRRPSIIVDVTSQEEKIHRAIGAYRSQMEIDRFGTPIDELLFLYRRQCGIEIGARLGEPFITDQIPDVRVDELFR
jgi:bacillithiol biosynthesis deacetylase BshB1